MKIAFEAKRAFHNRTGLGNYSRFILQALLKSNTYPIAFTNNNHKKLFPEFPINQIRFYGSGLTGAVKRVTGWGLALKEFDIFHGLSNELPYFLPSNIKKVVTIHDLIFLRYPQFYPFFDRMIYRFKFKNACKKADQIIAISERTKADIIEFYNTEPNKIKVIYQGYKSGFNEKISKSEVKHLLETLQITKPFVLCVGTIEERKNQLRLAQAFELAKLSNWQLIFVGKGKEYKNKLEKFAATSSDIKILSNIDNLQLQLLYQACSFVAYPSLYEGFGIPVIEGIAAGKAVLAAKGSCLEEAGGSGALYVQATDVQNMAEKLKQLACQPELRTKLAQNGTEYIKKFDCDKITEQYLQLYKNLL